MFFQMYDVRTSRSDIPLQKIAEESAVRFLVARHLQDSLRTLSMHTSAIVCERERKRVTFLSENLAALYENFRKKTKDL